MELAGLLIEQRAPLTDGNGLAAVPLLRRLEFDCGVALLMAVSVHECRRPLAGASSLPAKGLLG
jgi:hypothetical protein